MGDARARCKAQNARAKRPLPMMTRLAFEVPAQPTDTTCGPTCLHAVYRYHGDAIALETVIEQTRELRDGGTLDAFLALHALARGYRARIYLHNLAVFDPSWAGLPRAGLIAKLEAQLPIKRDTHPKLAVATQGYIEVLRAGGELRMADLTGSLLRKYLTRGVPILTGLSSTWLYRTPRERPDNEFDDLRGEPGGHFVVLSGYDRGKREVWVADPWAGNPFDGEARVYPVKIERLIAAVLLGVVSYDCNLLVIEPPRNKRTES